MSKKNIIEQKDVGKKVHITFNTPGGQMTYEYSGSSVRALRRGTDPSQLSGRLIEHTKPGK